MENTTKMLDAAAREMVQNGYAASSLSSIAGRMGLTKGALARKFPTKESLALSIIATLRATIAEELERSTQVYAESGLRGMVRFLLAIGAHATHEPQVAAAVILLADRSTPAHPIADLLEDWTDAIQRLLDEAQQHGEIPDTADTRTLAEYVLVTNMGEAVFGARAYTPQRPTPRLRFMRITLRICGASDVDDLVDEVLQTHAAGSLPQIPPRAGIATLED